LLTSRRHIEVTNMKRLHRYTIPLVVLISALAAAGFILFQSFGIDRPGSTGDSSAHSSRPTDEAAGADAGDHRAQETADPVDTDHTMGHAVFVRLVHMNHVDTPDSDEAQVAGVDLRLALTDGFELASREVEAGRYRFLVPGPSVAGTLREARHTIGVGLALHPPSQRIVQVLAELPCRDEPARRVGAWAQQHFVADFYRFGGLVGCRLPSEPAYS
jgi:hypothetical protein